MTMMNESLKTSRQGAALSGRSSRTGLSVPVALALTALAGAASAMAQATFQTLGDLPGGNVWSLVYGVSADGLVIVGNSSSANGQEAFAWTQAGGMIGLGDLAGGIFQSNAAGVSADGSVIVGTGRSTAGTEVFRWTQAGGMVGLGDLPGGGFSSNACGVSADGSVSVGQSYSAASGNQGEAFRWTEAAGMVGLGDFPGSVFASQATGVSADGLVIVGASASSNGGDSFRWTQATGMVSLGDVPNGQFDNTAWAISADGGTIAGVAVNVDGSYEAYRWTSATGMVGLGLLSGGNPPQSEARGVSGDGSIIVGFAVDAVGQKAMIWDATHGLRDLNAVLVNDHGLNLNGFRMQMVWSITPDGHTIVGWGLNAAGRLEAFRVTLPDCASCVGDLTCDQTVGLADLTVVLSHFGVPSGATREDGDLDADGDVDLSDLTILLSQFGRTCP